MGSPDEEVDVRVVFVHGACVSDGAWWWQRTGDVLASRGIRSDAPALPSCGEGGRTVGHGGPGLADDVAAVRAELQRSEEPTIVVVHSYGGIVAAEAAAGLESVRHLIYVSSYLAEVGESLASFSGSEPAPFLDVDLEAGTFGARADMFGDTFLQDCPELVEDGKRRLARQSLSVTQQPVGAAAWRETATTYLICLDDRGTPAERQRVFAERAQRVVEISAGHHPFLSRPDEVAELVLGGA